ncbi:hypothetical protein CSKR_106507 [Clonorchis sinensis]|uniref:Uncharacterized protein n=1 Tax=Clonorchis sinensis TaxID=79923 RepID=A0A3R7FN20_CLOSI|nr:hypothetical protein CSKR_106507 [Clonorchis sinensis]
MRQWDEMAQSANLLTGRSVVQTRPLPLDFPRLGLGNLAQSQPSCFLLVAWQLETERVPQLNDCILLFHPKEAQGIMHCQVAQAYTGAVEMQRSGSNHGSSDKYFLLGALLWPHQQIPLFKSGNICLFRRTTSLVFSMCWETTWLSGQSTNLLTGRSVVRTRPLHVDFPCLGLGNLAQSQPSCFLRVTWQLSTESVSER